MRAILRAAVMGRNIAFAATVAVAMLWPAAAYSEPFCLPIKFAERAIASNHGEELFAIGSLGSRVMRIYANPETRSWTVLSLAPNGVACVIGSGTDLEFVSPAKPDIPS